MPQPYPDRIIQIIQATGTDAVYISKSPIGMQGRHWFRLSVACWALVEHKPGDTSVFGMEAGEYVDFIDTDENFALYLCSSEEDSQVEFALMGRGYLDKHGNPVKDKTVIGV